ncbi:hypothetical protein O181_030105 [Austropuccinia psidii MF-1]|uniref:Transcription factor IIIC subunit 5 HTH domain-containing protein n=1 Tax=Austropuccinia psidii MF-1 TaxID=1389203 RepID=A0A9Q3H5W0_9BASI|nr:hypothetical protein [Austropuccinia psidii MF-1]
MISDKTSHKLSRSGSIEELTAIECPLRLKEDHHPDKSLTITSSSSSNPENQDKFDRLINRLGGYQKLSAQLEAKDPNRPVELQLNSKNLDNEYIRPISGEWVPTSNILIKVIKRIKKSNNPNDNQESNQKRLYKIEPVGFITHTIRFRVLADYHFTPDLNHPMNLLARDMRALSAEGILKFRFQSETEDYSPSQIGLFPPPLFSKYLAPQAYQYKQNLASVPTQKADGTERLVNRSRFIHIPLQSITFHETTIPHAPLPAHLKYKVPEDEAICKRVSSLFEQRPVWSRLALNNQLKPAERRLIHWHKHILPCHCYTFADGVFRDLLIRFQYDPRATPEARFYQRISLRNLDNKNISERLTYKLLKRSVETGSIDNQRDHIFDGLELHQSVGTYQLCDITDSLLVSLIKSTKGVLPNCRIRDGWYTSNAIEQIRSILRRKFHALLDQKKVIRDTECVDLLEIDVSAEAADLMKKGRSTLNQPCRVHFEETEDASQTATTSRQENSSKKLLTPNPLYKIRPHKTVTKAKPANTTGTSRLLLDISHSSPINQLSPNVDDDQEALPAINIDNEDNIDNTDSNNLEREGEQGAHDETRDNTKGDDHDIQDKQEGDNTERQEKQESGRLHEAIDNEDGNADQEDGHASEFNNDSSLTSLSDLNNMSELSELSDLSDLSDLSELSELSDLSELSELSELSNLSNLSELS